MFPNTPSWRVFRRACFVHGEEKKAFQEANRRNDRVTEEGDVGTMNKVRVAIVGCGYWGQNLIRNFAESADVEVTAVCDFNLRTLARTKRRYPTVELKQDFQQILSDSRIHAVVIATPRLDALPVRPPGAAGQACSGGEAVGDQHPASARTDGTRGKT